MNHSQNQEQQAILNYFKDYIGIFIDIGANDGKMFSNTRALVEHGWVGVFVEPSPRAFAKLKSNYAGMRGLYFYPFAITDHNGKAMLQESGPLLSANDVGLVSTFHHDEMKRFKSIDYKPVQVTCFKWKTFLNRIKYKNFDMISIDVEGDELAILPEIDLSSTRLLCIEWNSKPHLKIEYEKYLSGFELIYTSPENLIYARS